MSPSCRFGYVVKILCRRLAAAFVTSGIQKILYLFYDRIQKFIGMHIGIRPDRGSLFIAFYIFVDYFGIGDKKDDEATYLVEQGVADPEDIDRTIKYGNGLRYTCSGPFKIADLGGLQVFNSVAKYLCSDLASDKDKNNLLDGLVAEGNNGISTGKGFYQYGESDLENEERTRDAMILGILKTEQELRR